MTLDNRWEQRFSNFEKALFQLSQGIEQNSGNPPDIVKEGIIQRFEFTHELARKVMKDYLEYQGYQNISGSRSASKEAFNKGLLGEGQLWEEVIIYGSRAKGNYREGSDIDITLIGKDLTEAIRCKISLEIDDLNTPYLFDISVFENLHSSDLEEYIVRVGQVFYSKKQ